MATKIDNLKEYLEKSAVIGKPFLTNFWTDTATDSSWLEMIKVDPLHYITRHVMTGQGHTQLIEIDIADTSAYYIEEYDFFDEYGDASKEDSPVETTSTINKACTCDIQDLFKGGCICGAVKPYKVTYE